MTSTERGDMPVSSKTSAGWSFGSCVCPRPRPQRGLVAVVTFILSVLAVGGVGAAQAVASEPTSLSYGEVGRFGGYNATGSVAGSEEGKLVEPVGFAVEPKSPSGEENDLYILDRTGFIKNEVADVDELQYRLEKLSSGGVVLAHTSFTVDFKEKKHYEDAHPLVGLAVDPTAERIYTLVESMPHSGSQRVPVVGWLVAWSTKTLDKPAGLTEGPVPGAGVVAELAGGEPSEPLTGEGLQLKKPANEDLYLPQAIAVDESSGDVVVEAQHGVQSGVGGPLMLAKIETDNPTASEPIEEEWVAEAGNIAPNGEIGGGLFPIAGDASEFGVALWSNSGAGQAARLGVVESTLQSTHGALLDSQAVAHSKELATAPMVELLKQPPNGSSKPESSALSTNAAGSAITQIRGESGVYAAIYSEEASGRIIDTETGTKPWEALGGGNLLDQFWISGGAEDYEWANVGIRLFESKNGETTILNTIGGGDPKVAPWEGPQRLEGTCSINAAAGASLQTGANGALFVLTTPDDKKGQTGLSSVGGGEVIEFAPAGAYPGMHTCPAVTGNVEVNGHEATGEAGKLPMVTAYANESTKFNAITLDRKVGWMPPVELTSGIQFTWSTVEWQPFAFEWDFNAQSDEGYTAIAKIEESDGQFLWPSPEATHVYSEPGTYEAEVRVSGDYGTKVFPFEVKVNGTQKPVAAFECPAEIAVGKAVTCDASKSTPTENTSIETYKWELIEKNTGAKEAKTGATPTIPLTFKNTGEYEVKLTIKDEEGAEKEASTTQTVTVKAHTKAEEEVIKHEEEVAAQKKVEEEAAATAKKAEEEAAAKKASEEAAARKKAEEEAAAKTASTGPSIAPPSVGPSIGPPSSVVKPLTSAQKLALALKACHKDKGKKRAACEKAAKAKYSPPKKKKKSKGKGKR